MVSSSKRASLRFGVQTSDSYNCEEEKRSLRSKKELKVELKPIGRAKRETITKKEEKRSTFSERALGT